MFAPGTRRLHKFVRATKNVPNKKPKKNAKNPNDKIPKKNSAKTTSKRGRKRKTITDEAEDLIETVKLLEKDLQELKRAKLEHPLPAPELEKPILIP